MLCDGGKSTLKPNYCASFLIAGLCLLPAMGIIAAPLSSIQFSPDITIDPDDTLVADENVAEDNLSGGVSLTGVGAIPPNADVTAYHVLENGDRLLAFDITVELAGSILISPVDIVRYDGGAFSLEFDGSALGVPAGTRIDAVSMDAKGDLLISFDITILLDGLLFADEDLARFDGVDFSMFFDGSMAGIDPSLDLDAMHFNPGSNTLLMSFDGSGQVDGTQFSDEDLLEYGVVAQTWGMAFDGSANHSVWVAADLDAAYAILSPDSIFKDGFEEPAPL